MALKKKKLLDKEIGTIQATMYTMEQQCMMLEQAITQVDTVAALRVGKDAMAAATAKLGGVDAVQDVMDDAAEQLEDADEMNEVLAQGIGGGLMGLMDDEELLGELDEIEAEQLDDELHDLEPVPLQPVVAPPQAEPEPAAAEEGDAELDRMLAQMAPG